MTLSTNQLIVTEVGADCVELVSFKVMTSDTSGCSAITAQRLTLPTKAQ